MINGEAAEPRYLKNHFLPDYHDFMTALGWVVRKSLPPYSLYGLNDFLLWRSFYVVLPRDEIIR
jgi:hypothetical protein